MCGTPRAARQSRSRRRRTMLRLSVLLILLTQRARTAHVTEQPTFANRLEKLYEKIEKLTAAPIERDEGRSAASPREKSLAKLDTLSSLGNSKLDLSVGGEESLYGMLTEQQVRSIVRDLQRLEVADDERNSDGEYGDGDWNDDDDYPMDEEWDGEEPESNSLKAPLLGSRLGAASGTPSAITKLDRRPASVAAQQLALTNERPAVLDDSNLSPSHKMTLKRAAMDNLLSVVHAKKCLTPQPRWYSVRQLAPAADTVYTPSCVQLHRCAPDSGCCYTEGEVCAPVEGKHVAKAFYLHKANGEVTVSRVVFYNHTRCACVNSDALNDVPKVEPSPDTVPVQSFEIETTVRQHRVTTSAEWQPSTEEPKLERDAEASESTEPPQLIRRCTCPALFKARPNESGCHCVCDWPSVSRRRDCQLLAKGKEHFGLKDRVCVDNGDCHPPACEYGPYNRDAGQCPVRKYKRPRLHARGRYND